jgi:hypothetical protein
MTVKYTLCGMNAYTGGSDIHLLRLFHTYKYCKALMKVRTKIKVVPQHARKALGGRGCIAPTRFLRRH